MSVDESPRFRVLIVDDDEDDYLIASEMLAGQSRSRFEAEWSASFDAGLERMRERVHDVYLIDQRLGARTGLELAREAFGGSLPAPVILLTGLDDYSVDREASMLGATDFLVKSELTPRLLERSIRYSIRQHDVLAVLRQSQRGYARAKDEAERANRAKDEFLSRMSHELRTPLNAILGFGQLLELENLTDRQREDVGHILSGGGHLLELINEVLDISRIESGSIRVSIEPVHVGSALAEVLSMIKPLADAGGIRLVCDPSDYEETWIAADARRLRQVLINLLSNAVKYNARGGRAEVVCGEGADGRIRIEVIDDGWGMDEAQIERLYLPFERLGAESTGVEGTGLGLALTKRLLNAMGGEIEVVSEPGVGTTMRIALDGAEDPADDRGPTAGRFEQPAAERAESVDIDCTVLYIDDNRDSLEVVKRALGELAGVRILTAGHGGAGVALAREHHPDLVLLDLHLPDIDGAEVLRQLRAEPATAALPVTIVSADATSSRKELRAAGANGYMTKPVDVAALKDLVAAIRAGKADDERADARWQTAEAGSDAGADSPGTAIPTF